jgi:hypothetical protein
VPAAAEDEVRPRSAYEPVAGAVEAVDRRCKPDLPGTGDPKEADEGARLRDASREGLLSVARVARLEDRQPATGEARRCETGKARSVGPSTDGDLERRAADALRHDLAAVGNVKCDRPAAEGPLWLGEREVVDAATGQRLPLGCAGVKQRGQAAARTGKGRARSGAEQPVAPEVSA